MKVLQIFLAAAFTVSQVKAAPIVITPEMEAMGIHPVKAPFGVQILRDTMPDPEKRIVIDGEVQAPVKMPGGLEISMGKRNPEPFVVTPEMQAAGFKPLDLPPGMVALRDEIEKRSMPLEVEEFPHIPFHQLKHPLPVGQDAMKRSEHSIPLGVKPKPILTSRGMPIEFDFEDTVSSPNV